MMMMMMNFPQSNARMLPPVIKQKDCLEDKNSCGWKSFKPDSTNVFTVSVPAFYTSTIEIGLL